MKEAIKQATPSVTPVNTEDCVVPRKVRRQANYLRRRTRGL